MTGMKESDQGFTRAAGRRSGLGLIESEGLLGKTGDCWAHPRAAQWAIEPKGATEDLAILQLWPAEHAAPAAVPLAGPLCQPWPTSWGGSDAEPSQPPGT